MGPSSASGDADDHVAVTSSSMGSRSTRQRHAAGPLQAQSSSGLMGAAEDASFVNPVAMMPASHQPSNGNARTNAQRLQRQRQAQYKAKRSDSLTGSSNFGLLPFGSGLRLPSTSSASRQQQHQQQQSWRKNLRYPWFGFMAFAVGGALLTSRVYLHGSRHRRPSGDAKMDTDEETKRRILGLGGGSSSNFGDRRIERKGILPWELANSGRDPSRDRLVKWWRDNPTAPVGLSCAAFDEGRRRATGGGGGGRSNGKGGRSNGGASAGASTAGDVYDDDSPNLDGFEETADDAIAEAEAEADSNAVGRHYSRVAAAATTTLTTDPIADTYFYHGYGIPPPIFQGRTPPLLSAATKKNKKSSGHSRSRSRVQVAFVLPFVEFQLVKVEALLSRHWSQYPPCLPDTPRQDADLVFFTENQLSVEAQRRVLSYYAELGPERTGCFRTDEPKFLSLANEVDIPNLSHLEGAAFTFYSLSRLLESSYQSFLLAEPDVAPVQSNFLPALVERSHTVNCKDDGYWQVGSIPLARDVDAGMLRERLDYHMNGNALYVLGCPEFEDYKCRVQTFYVPKDDCALVAGCQTHEAYEGGYDHALYRFRMHPDNYEYSRLVLHRFGYSNFIQNRGEGVYRAEDIVRDSPSTYFVHSKSIYMSTAATILKEVTVSVLKRDPCGREAAIEKELQRIHQYLRSGEYTKADAVRHLCEATKYKIFGPTPSTRVCDMYANTAMTTAASLTDTEYRGGGSTDPQVWRNRMPGRAYLWTMDFHGGPTNCDLSVITEAGGAVHAEIDGICDFYGLCKDRLKVIKADNWKEFDPTEQQKVDFRRAYENDPEFERVDAFICHHPVANCELFLPFNKSIIVHATTRLEFGRHDEGIDWRLSSGYDREVGKEKWKKWVRTVQRLALDKRNVIAANNAYDRDYIKYFTGVKNVELLPSWCGEGIGVKFCEPGWESSLTHGWFPTRPEVVIVPYRSNLDRTRYKTGVRDPVEHPIIKELAAVPQQISNGTEVKMIRELYSDANPLRMLKHPAIVILPYQISTMQLVELYRLNIPTFCPSLSLLKRWCREHDLMWEVHYGWPENLMGVKDIPNPNGRPMMDKYSKEWEEIFDHWVPKSDFYQYDHIHYFDSWEHFFRQYQVVGKNGQLEEINRKMAATNSAIRESLVEQWRTVLDRVRGSSLIKN